MKNIFYPIFLLLTVILAACGEDDKFVIRGSIDGDPATNMRIIYYFDGKMHSGVTATTDGKFAFESSAPERAMLEFYDNDYRLLGRTIVVNGDELEVDLKQGQPYAISVRGNELGERWAEFLNKNATSLASAKSNDFVAKYVKSNPNDILAGLLLATEYKCDHTNAATANELWNSLAEEARPDDMAGSFHAILKRMAAETASEPVKQITYLASGNRRDTFKTADHRLSLISVSDERSKRHDMLTTFRHLDSLHKKNKFEILDLSVDKDTLIWRQSVRLDSAKWVQGWAPGSIAGKALNPLGIPSVPYFIATDSAGAQIWRGSELEDAQKFITDYYND